MTYQYPKSVDFLASIIEQKKDDHSPNVKALVAGARAALEVTVPGHHDKNAIPLWNRDRMVVLDAVARAFAHELGGNL